MALYWALFGVTLIVIEMILPGIFFIFLGLGAFATAGILQLGFISDLSQAFFCWLGSSTLFVFTLRKVFMRLAPSETEIGSIDEDKDAYGKEVEVLHTVFSDNEEGRIIFRGSTWAAKCPKKILRPGEKAILKKRHLNLWIVEPLE